jgi:hypothetical protein
VEPGSVRGRTKKWKEDPTMIEGLVFLVLMFALFVVVPLLLLKTLFHLVLWVILLPFRILGAALGLVFGVVGVLAKVLFAGLGVVAVLVGLAFGLVLLPLLPIVLIAGVIWLAVRAASPRPVAVRRTV